MYSQVYSITKFNATTVYTGDRQTEQAMNGIFLLDSGRE